MDFLLDLFRGMSFPQAASWLLVENIALFGVSMGLGHLLLVAFARHRVVETPPPTEWKEWAWAGSCVLLNTVVTIAGLWLWQRGLIVIVPANAWRSALDVVVLFLAMDFLMYVFHRLAHLAWIYPWVHGTHHRYDKPRPLNLFVLNPFEVLGFGALWLGLISLYHSTWYGMLIYLALNLLFGTVGHLGVEPLPRMWMRLPVLRHLGTSTFHARHHEDGNVNFGFYTDVWDRLFRSLHRRYAQTFGQLDSSPSN